MLRFSGRSNSIGNYAFAGCTALVPEWSEDSRLEEIGNGAFSGCSTLKTMIPGLHVRIIGKEAFNSCTSLETLILPPGVESYGENLIRGCYALKTLIIGGPGCPVIPSNAFEVKSSASALQTLVLREGVTEISDSAFANMVYSYSIASNGYRALTSLSLPSTLEHIGDNAFQRAVTLGRVYILNRNIVISETAFANCPNVELIFEDGFLLTVYDGETELYSGNFLAGADLTVLLQSLIPADGTEDAFLGWRMADSTSPEGEWTTMPAFDLTLYACRKPLRTLNLKLWMDGVVEDYQTLRLCAGVIIPWPEEPVCEGCQFGGWYEDADLTKAFRRGSRMPDEDWTIYARMDTYVGNSVYRFTADHAELLHYVPDPRGSTKVWLPTKVNGLPLTGIATDAFRDSPEITMLHLPDGLSDFDPAALENLPNLFWLSIDDSNPTFRTQDGILYTADMKEVIRCPLGSHVFTYHAPETVRKVRSRAFYQCDSLYEVLLRENVSEIGKESFDGCSSLERFTAMGLTAIGEDAIHNISGHLKVYGPVKTGYLRSWLMDANGRFTIPYNAYGITLFVNGSRYSVMSLEAGSLIPQSILRVTNDDGTIIDTWFTNSQRTIPWDESQATPEEDLKLYASTIQTYLWENATITGEDDTTVSGIRLTGYNGFGGDLVLPTKISNKTVIAIGENFLASSRGRVASVRIGSEVIEIAETALVGPEEYPFGGVIYADAGSYAEEWANTHGYTCRGATYVLSFETNGGALLNSKEMVWNAETILPVPVKTGCEFNGWYTDARLRNPVTLVEGCYVMPRQDTTLYAGWTGEAVVFPYEYAVDEESTPNTVTILRYTGDGGEVTIPSEINGAIVTAIADEAFRNTSATKITIPDTVTTIGNRVFANCSSLESVQIGAGVSAIGVACFVGCTDLEEIWVADGNTLYQSVDDGVLLAGNVTLLCYPAGRMDKTYTLPASIVAIAQEAFRGASALESVTLSDSLVAIGKEAFADCTGLQSFTVTNTMNVTTIPEGCFSGCTSLTQVSLGTHVTAIEGFAFFGCNNLSKLLSLSGNTAVAEDVPVFTAENLIITCHANNPIRPWALARGIHVECTDKAMPATIQVTAAKYELAVGESTELTCTILPTQAVTEDMLLFWHSSDENVIRVEDGIAYAVLSGTAEVTVETENGKSASLTLTVLHTHAYIPHASKIPTCVSRGNTFYYSCAGCGLYFDEQKQEIEEGSWYLPISHIHPSTGYTCRICGQTFDPSGLNTLQLPQFVTSVEMEAFSGSAAEVIIVPLGCETLGQNAFDACSHLQILVLPDSFTDEQIRYAMGTTSCEVVCTTP